MAYKVHFAIGPLKKSGQESYYPNAALRLGFQRPVALLEASRVHSDVSQSNANASLNE